jgi:hypothetical protein
MTATSTSLYVSELRDIPLTFMDCPDRKCGPGRCEIYWCGNSDGKYWCDVMRAGFRGGCPRGLL